MTIHTTALHAPRSSGKRSTSLGASPPCSVCHCSQEGINGKGDKCVAVSIDVPGYFSAALSCCAGRLTDERKSNVLSAGVGGLSDPGAANPQLQPQAEPSKRRIRTVPRDNNINSSSNSKAKPTVFRNGSSSRQSTEYAERGPCSASYVAQSAEVPKCRIEQQPCLLSAPPLALPDAVLTTELRL